jgi:hypothetical protein
MADLEQNFVQLQLMHESLARFSESFAGFLYGMNMNAFCVDFPEVRKGGEEKQRWAIANSACVGADTRVIQAAAKPPRLRSCESASKSWS